MSNGSSGEHSFIFFRARKVRGYNPLQTAHCFPLGMDNTDQSKNLVRHYIIPLATLDELVAREQIILRCSFDEFNMPIRDSADMS